MKLSCGDTLTADGQTATITQAWRSDGDIDFLVSFPDRCSGYYALRSGKIQPRRKGQGWGSIPPRVGWINPELKALIKAQWVKSSAE